MSAAISFWQPMASMVTTAPFRSSSSSNSGMAVISSDLASVATCPKVKWFSTDQALTTWSADRCQFGRGRGDRSQSVSSHQRRDPGGEALLKGHRVEQAEDSSEGVVRG